MFNTLSNVMCTVGVCKLCCARRKNKVGITVVIKSHEVKKGLQRHGYANINAFKR